MSLLTFSLLENMTEKYESTKRLLDMEKATHQSTLVANARLRGMVDDMRGILNESTTPLSSPPQQTEDVTME
jgi:hypothetical protein